MPSWYSGVKDRFTIWLRGLPVPVKTALKRVSVFLDPLLIAVHRLRRRDRRPVPPIVFRTRIGTAWSIGDFFHSGQVVADSLAGALQYHHDLAFSDFSSILDFGAGCGRVVQHVAPHAPGARISACDVDAEAIGWARDHYPGIEWKVNQFDPPLPFDDESFDLVYSISIFTHLDRESQDRWLEELHRVVRPDGMVFVTVASDTQREQFRKGDLVSNTDGFMAAVAAPTGGETVDFFAYERSGWNEADFPGIGQNYGMTFNSVADIAERWSKTFEILHHHEGAINYGQDLVVLRRRD